MSKVFISGEDSIKNELISLLKGKAEITDKLNPETDIIFECTNYDKGLKSQNLKFVDENCSASIPVFTSSLCISVSEQSAYSKYPARLIGIGPSRRPGCTAKSAARSRRRKGEGLNNLLSLAVSDYLRRTE